MFYRLPNFCDSFLKMDPQPFVRFLFRTRPEQLETIHPCLDQADTLLITRLCPVLHIDVSAVMRLITKVWIEGNKERVDIICDYGVETNSKPKVVAYEVTIRDTKLITSPLHHPYIRLRVNKEVEAWRELEAKYGMPFPGRTDLRISQRRQYQLRQGSASSVSMH